MKKNKMQPYKRIMPIMLSILLCFSLAACKEQTAPFQEDAVVPQATDNSVIEILEEDKSYESPAPVALAGNDKIDVLIGSTVLTAALADNSSAAAFLQLLQQGDVTVDMHDYGNFEKVGDLPQSIVTNDEQITTQPGDIILYLGNRITIYYDTNSWDFTRLGKLDDITQSELKALLGDGDITVTFRLHTNAQVHDKTLVVYFSATGTTQGVAETIAAALDAALYQIVPEVPYTDNDLNYSDSDSRTSREQNDDDARPAILGSVENWEQYDTVLIGYPIWWGDAPRIISTFVCSYDFSGKTVAVFCTSGSSDIATSIQTLAQQISGATLQKGMRFQAGASQQDALDFASSIGLD